MPKYADHKASYSKFTNKNTGIDIQKFLKEKGFKNIAKDYDPSRHRVVNIRNDSKGKRFWFTEQTVAKKGLTDAPVNAKIIDDLLRWVVRATNAINPLSQPRKTDSGYTELTPMNCPGSITRRQSVVPPQHDEMSAYYMKKQQSQSKSLVQDKPKPTKARAGVGRAVEDLIGSIMELK